MNEIEHDAIVCDGKYRVQFFKTGEFYALRHGEYWRDLCGDGLVLALVQEIDDLKNQLKEAQDVKACKTES